MKKIQITTTKTCSKEGCENPQHYRTSNYCKHHHALNNKKHAKKYGNVSTGIRAKYYQAKYPVAQSAVYAITDGEGTLLYVGESSNAPFRLYQHIESKSGHVSEKLQQHDGLTYSILWEGESGLMRKMKEAYFIYTLQPIYNTIYKKKRKI